MAHQRAPAASIEFSFNRRYWQSRFAVPCWVVTACSSASQAGRMFLTQNNYLAIASIRGWGLTVMDAVILGWKGGPATETLKLNEKQGKKPSVQTGSRKKDGENNTALATRLGS